MSDDSYSESEQILSSGPEPELEPLAIWKAPAAAHWISSSSSEDETERHIRLLERVSNPAELTSFAREALQEAAQRMEEQDLAYELTHQPEVRDIPDLDQPIYVRASNTDPKIMTPTAMLKATPNNPRPPNIPNTPQQPETKPP